MTSLHKKMPPLTEAEYQGLVKEAIYWLQQPEVQEDPVARNLAAHTGEMLGRISPTKDTFFAEEVHLNLQQLKNGVAEATILLSAVSFHFHLVLCI
uniref:Uncharacterized protein n=1 Tax=Paramormyrops kingsleyae TaxID=1676925 RepID=A0A3B3QGI7_9TELE